mmetsp:Transcript_19222/g.50563  ORF Transcript_19222/g.50563 Transcript_19222/m.50563 type:complete len:358 (+) Transcript_19222:185-1258(+)
MATAAAGACPVQAPRVPDNVDRCIAKMVASVDMVSELDQSIVLGVTITAVPPSATGFPAWSRHEDYIESEADRDRGHADWAVPEGADNSSPRVLFCHGGGYEFYNPQDVYQPTTSRLEAATGMPVFTFDYRLIPEFRHPAQLEDAVQAFLWLAENGPQGPGKASALFLAGDSAGGGLALALAVRLRDHPVEGAHVAGVAVVSPETDLTCGGESYTSRRWQEGGGDTCDPMFRDEDPVAASMPQIYRLLGVPGEHGSFPLTTLDLSVLHAALHDLPPMQIHVGDAEVMLSDSVEFGKKACASGSPVEVHVWPRMWHTFTQYSEGCGGDDAEPLQEAVEALKQQADFLKGLAAKLLARR